MENFASHEHDESVTCRDYMRTIFRQKLIIIITVLTTLTVVFIGLELKTPKYEAKVKMLISAEKQVTSPYLVASRDIEVALTQSEIVKSNAVIGRVVEALELDKIPLDYEKKFASSLKGHLINYNKKRIEMKLLGLSSQAQEQLKVALARKNLKDNIKVEPIRDSNVFSIIVKDFTPERAAKIANVVSRAYVIFDLEQQIAEIKMKYGEKHLAVKQQMDAINKVMTTLDGRTLDAVDAIGPASVKIVEQALVPLEPIGLGREAIYMLAFLVSFFLGLILAFIFEYMDQTFKNAQDVETFLNIPFLGAIPRQMSSKKMIIQDTKIESPYLLSYQNLSDQIYLLMRDKKLKKLIFSSAMSREGTSAIISNLSILLSEKLHYKVLLIDANLRHSSIDKYLGISKSEGLAEVLEDKALFKSAIQRIELKEFFEKRQKEKPANDVDFKNTYGKTAIKSPHLDVLASGATDLNPVTLLTSKKMEEVLEEASKHYEIVFIDCANMTSFKDAAILSTNTDGIIVVINESRTRRQVVKNALISLKDAKANIVGAILNNRTFPIPDFVYDKL